MKTNLRKLLGSSFLIIATLIGNAQEQQKPKGIDSNYVFSHYTERLSYFESLPHRMKKPVVFLGNSITEAGRWNDILPGQSIVNRGISGDISFGVLARLNEIISLNPSKVFLMIGINDLKREIPPELIVENYRRIVSTLKKESPKTKIYLQSVLPINPSILIEAFKNVTNSEIDVLNQGLQAVALEHDVIYVDVKKVFSNANGELIKEYSPDGIHLHLSAYPVWIAYLKDNKYL